METVIEFSRYLIALLYGSLIATSFAGMTYSRRNYIILCLFNGFLFFMQIVCLQAWGMEITMQLYPLLSHFPVVLFIYLFLNRSLLISLVSMFASFLCCQPARWIGAVSGEVFNNATIDHIGYIIGVIISYYFLQKYAVKSVRHLLKRSEKSCLLFGAMPILYYLFDYVATNYSGFMYKRASVQFMPFMTAAVYFVLVLLYYAETQKQVAIQREHDMLETQFKQAQIEFASLKQIQQNAIAYRHDLRHHIAHLQNLASSNNLEEIKGYLKAAQDDIEEITPVSYSRNETLNLILSSYASKAKHGNIELSIDIKLPDSLPFSETELCSLLSNALENAITATMRIVDDTQKMIKLRMFSKNNKICIDIRNTFQQEPVFNDGMPVTLEEGHGFGTKSMAHIIKKHGGVYQFSVQDGWFSFRASA